MVVPVMTKQILYNRLHDIYVELLTEKWVFAYHMSESLMNDIHTCTLLLLLPSLQRTTFMHLHNVHIALLVKEYKKAHDNIRDLSYAIHYEQ